ncbi:MAG: ABC transporter permease [Gammaproteobacteria bacterium]|uniref:ABC transporter permease n=1 Tax=Methylotuvimicrobium sp. TaxID=2822413 RepID=UPI001D41362D|nr:ABC transporter permease [Gammaproteobacteria bacterium]
MMLKLAIASLWNRKLTVTLTVLSIAVGVFLLLGVEHIRSEAKNSFSKTVSGVDLIVGARTGPLNLLLYSVFHIGNASNNISWQSYREFSQKPEVAWSIPISLGDSHKGYRVVGTSRDFFEHFHYGQKQNLAFKSGRAFDGVYEAVVGAQVAKTLDYQPGQSITLAHGIAKVGFSKHDDKPFIVTGILAPTGTPVDQAVYVSLAGIEAIHIDWQGGVHIPGRSIGAEDALKHDLTPKSITAFMVGLNSKISLFSLQREINNYRDEALVGIMPGITLMELWQMIGALENILQLISILVLFATLMGLSTMLLASMKEREREMAVLRAIGAHAGSLFFLIEIEALVVTVTGILVGSTALCIALLTARTELSEQYGLFIGINPFTPLTFQYLLGILAVSFVLALLPSVSAYRNSLGSGLVVRT